MTKGEQKIKQYIGDLMRNKQFLEEMKYSLNLLREHKMTKEEGAIYALFQINQKKLAEYLDNRIKKIEKRIDSMTKKNIASIDYDDSDDEEDNV